MNGIDFNNSKGSNLGDPKFGQDAVNLRTAYTIANNAISNISSGLTATSISSTAITTTNLVATNTTGITSSFQTLNTTTLTTSGLTAQSISTNSITATTSVINTITATTVYMEQLRLIPITYSPTPNKGLMFFSDVTDTLYVYTGNTVFDIVALT